MQQILEPDVIETALAHALTAATEARQWELVAQLARELQGAASGAAETGGVGYRRR
ncbi:MAG TPA: hypothetical protein VFS67_14895 [Polyangiaceae bacterium]|nr:hypothetical protein [Polyangiaceae bacterium]